MNREYAGPGTRALADGEALAALLTTAGPFRLKTPWPDCVGFKCGSAAQEPRDRELVI